MIKINQDSMHREKVDMEGLGQVIKCQGVGKTKTGKPMWRCFINFDYEVPKEKQIKDRCMNVLAFGQLATYLKAWKRGDILLVKGQIKKNVYQGKEYFQVIAGYVHDQHDYSTENGDDTEDGEGEVPYSAEDFDPGF